jgi:hypothetical protein
VGYRRMAVLRREPPRETKKLIIVYSKNMRGA